MTREFDDLTDVYEALVDWPRRLANESPFYQRLFERLGVRRIIDVACGTGQHAALFHSWGLQVEGADVSPRMIESARAALGEPSGLSWAVRSFGAPVTAEGSFDVAVCVGNSLALAPDHAHAHAAVRQMLAAVRSGGAVVVHVLNLWHLPDGPCVWQKIRRVQIPRGDVLIAKGVHRAAARGFVDLVVAPLTPDREPRSESIPFLGLEAAELEEAARAGGAADVQLFGDYQSRPYDRAASVDLIMLATKI